MTLFTKRKTPGETESTFPWNEMMANISSALSPFHFTKQENLLARQASLSQGSLSLSPLQSQVEGLVGSFAHQATDLSTLSAMVVGGMAYRVGRVGIMGSGVGVQNFACARMGEP